MKARHLKKVMQQINQSQEQARLDRLEHELNMKKAQNQLHNSKHGDYCRTKQKQKEIEMDLQLSKRE